MKHLLLMLLLSVASMAQQWTVYYSQTATGNADGSITVTPTVSITGNDGGYCSPFNGYQGEETPAVMLNGNAWQFGTTIGSGDMDGNPNDINFAHTFPNVTLPANGAKKDLSYAAKVHNVCFILDQETYTPAYSENPFYSSVFLDGYGPTIYPAPCSILNCAQPWPALWRTVPTRGVQHNLVSFVASNWTQVYTTFYGPPVVQEGLVCHWGSIACSPGTTPTCKNGSAPGVGPPCSQYVKASYVIFNGTCVAVWGGATAGPGPCD